MSTLEKIKYKRITRSQNYTWRCPNWKDGACHKGKAVCFEIDECEAYHRLEELEDKIEDGDLIFITKDAEPRIIVDEDHNVAMITNSEKLMPEPPNSIICGGYNYTKSGSVYKEMPGTVYVPFPGIKEEE